MAGMGKRMRPHTLVTPKPLIQIAGKSIVQRLTEYLAANCGETIENIAFITGRFGADVEHDLIAIAEKNGSAGSIHYQDEPLGTAHAILCAAEKLKGRVIIAFADTLYFGKFSIPADCDGMIWVHNVENWQQFGVVKVNEQGVITDFIEKSQTFVSNKAIIGIYYFKSGENLEKELNYLIENNIRDKGEYQITSALENMKNKSMRLLPGEVEAWLDCGNVASTLDTHRQVLEHEKQERLIDKTAHIENSTIIPPCYIGPHATVQNSVIGPHVSIGQHSKIDRCLIQNSIVQNHSFLTQQLLQYSMIGNHVSLTGKFNQLSAGDYSTES
jgi:glucose-1-phosphate thymidylyltransferase